MSELGSAGPEPGSYNSELPEYPQPFQVEVLESGQKVLVVEQTIESWAWNSQVVDNIISASERGEIRAIYHAGSLRVEFLPLSALPDQVGHITSVEALKHTPEQSNWGAAAGFTYIQTVDFAVEPNDIGQLYVDASGREHLQGRLIIDAASLLHNRTVYLDPEGLGDQPEEYEKAFIVDGNIPSECILKRDEVLLRPEPYSPPDIEQLIDDYEAHAATEADRLQRYVETSPTVQRL